MGRAAGAACAVLLGIAAFPAVARAQTDYRNLDDGRPVRTEDAFVVDHHEFEVLTPFTTMPTSAGRGATPSSRSWNTASGPTCS